MNAVVLADLDAAPALDLNPDLWQKNLAALGEVDQRLADELLRTRMPAHWRCVLGLDGAPAWRVELPGQACAWLDGTAAPTTRASALLTDFRPGNSNVLLATIGAGGELRRLLDATPAWCAVFVLEPNPLRTAAVLRAADLSAAIRQGRCVLVPPRAELEFLLEYLRRNVGVLLPGKLVLAPTVPSERSRWTQSLCQQVVQVLSHERAATRQQLAEHSQTVPRDPAKADGMRVAVVARGDGARRLCVAELLHRAACARGWETTTFTSHTPFDADPLVHSARLARLQPDLTLLVGHGPALLAVRPPGELVRLVLDAGEVPDDVTGWDTAAAATTPGVRKQLLEAGLPDERLHDFLWASDEAWLDLPAPASANAVLVVGDRHPLDEDACGITQPTHRRLWRQLVQTARDLWEQRAGVLPHGLLRRAETAAGVAVGDPELRREFARRIECFLIPSVLMERILRVLESEFAQILVVGKGWDTCQNAKISVIAGTSFELAQSQKPPEALAAVIPGRMDPLSHELVTVAALGWPVLLHAPGGALAASWLGDVLRPAEHVRTFSGAAELRGEIQALRADERAAVRRARNAREHLRRGHTISLRLIDLVGSLQLRERGSS